MTFDEARLMASVNARAEALFESGYRAHWAGPARLSVRNAGGTAYLVETLARTCECPFFQAHQGRYPCKHLLGWARLLWRQRSYRRMLSLVLGDLLDDLDEWKEWDGDPRPLAEAPPSFAGDAPLPADAAQVTCEGAADGQGAADGR